MPGDRQKHTFSSDRSDKSDKSDRSDKNAKYAAGQLHVRQRAANNLVPMPTQKTRRGGKPGALV